MARGRTRRAVQTFLLELLERRYDATSTAFAAQLQTKEWHRQLGGDVIADAILDRIVHNAIQMNADVVQMVLNAYNAAGPSFEEEMEVGARFPVYHGGRLLRCSISVPIDAGAVLVDAPLVEEPGENLLPLLHKAIHAAAEPAFATRLGAVATLRSCLPVFSLGLVP